MACRISCLFFPSNQLRKLFVFNVFIHDQPMLIKGLNSQKCFLCSVMRKRHSRNWDVSRFTYEFRMIIWCSQDSGWHFFWFPTALYLRILLDSLKPGSSQVGVHIYIASNCNHLNSTYKYSVYWFQISLYFISSVLMDLPFDPIITFVTILINYVG